MSVSVVGCRWWWRIRKWRGAFWERRYDGIVVSHEPEAQWQRLKYHLSHSVKEGLCESPVQWPGVHAAKALVHGEPLEGYWWNRSKEWAAKNRRQDFGRYDFATRYLVGFAPLPAFRHLSPEEYQDLVAGLIREIEEEGERKRDGNSAAGIEKILSQNPYEPPTRRTKRSTKPLFHVASKEARDDLRREREPTWRDTGRRRRRCVAVTCKRPAGFPRAAIRRLLPSSADCRRSDRRRHRRAGSRSWNRALSSEGRYRS